MILDFILFLLASLLTFTLPGIYLLQKSKTAFSWFEKMALGTIVGFVAFTLLSYILIVLRVPFLILYIAGIIDLVFIKSILTSKINTPVFPRKHFAVLLIIFILGIAGQMAIIAPSGLKSNQDLVFFSANGHDGAWHMALMEEIKKGYPLQNPIFAGEKLVNYHFFSDIAPAQFSRYFKFSNLDLYFRFFPFIYSILLGSIAFLLGRKLTNSFAAGVWSCVFVYFAGSFGYIVTWLQNKSIGGESIFWATQIQSSIGNPPQIISNILVFSFLYLLINLFHKKNWFLSLLSILVLGSLIEFKIYASIVILISLLIVGIVEFLKQRKVYLLFLFGLSSILSAFLYFPNSANSTSFLIWEPWWFIRTMIVVDSRLNWLDLELRRQTYLQEHNFKRVIQIEMTGFLIFFFGNLGTRFLGLIYIVKSVKNIFREYTLLMLLMISVVSLMLPLLFLQKGVASNTIQFLQYFLLIFGIFAATAIAGLQNRIRNNFLKVLFIALIVLFSIPTQIGLLYDFYHKPPLAKITAGELQALSFLKNNSGKNSTVLTAPFNKNLNLKMTTPFIWAWSDTSYVSALSSGKTYLADLEQVDIMGYQYKDRVAVQKFIFESSNTKEIVQKLKAEKIDYIYFPKQLSPKADFSIFLTKVFDNEQIEIFKVN